MGVLEQNAVSSATWVTQMLQSSLLVHSTGRSQFMVPTSSPNVTATGIAGVPGRQPAPLDFLHFWLIPEPRIGSAAGINISRSPIHLKNRQTALWVLHNMQGLAGLQGVKSPHSLYPERSFWSDLHSER